MNHAQFWGGGGAAPYEIEQSLRFNSGDSAYLSRTPASAGNRRTWTWSSWVKRTAFTDSTSPQYELFTVDSGGNDSDYFQLGFRANRLYIAGYTTFFKTTNALYRDASAWYHVVVSADTDNATASDRLKIYVNGVRIESFDVSNNPSAADLGVNRTASHKIGQEAGTNYFDGYMSEVNFIDGTALAPTDFGEYDDNGVWRPIRYTGSYGTNGFYLKFDPTATNGIGHDHSGNGNNWTPSGFTTSGTGTDVMDDTPTTNWATLNALSTSANGTFSDGNLRFAGASGWGGSKSSIAIPATGKLYAEFTLVSTSSNSAQADIGIFPEGNSNGYDWTGSYGLEVNNGFFLITNGSYSSNRGGTTAGGSIFQIAVDADNGRVWFGVDNSWYDTYNTTNGDPSAGTNPSGSSIDFSATTFFMGVKSELNTWVANFGQRDFAYTPPTNFLPLNTANLPAPDIADGSEYFKTKLYTGDGSTDNPITGVGFQPDFVWIKERNDNGSHQLYDAVRGATKRLESNNNTGETTITNGLKSFDPDGFSLGNYSNGNQLNITHASWNWLAANGTSTPSGGTIASTVSANPTAGFSIVSYTGTGVNATVAHGLNVAPKMVIVRKRSAAGGWIVGHSSIGWNNYIAIEDGAAGANSTIWQDTAPTSTVFSVGTNTTVNGSSATFIAYCFAEVEGYSKFGSYTGNGTDEDGPFVYTGFAVSWLLVKKSSGTGDWYISDNKRNTYNAVTGRIDANTSDIENTNNPWVDFLSNGFKIRDYDGSWNASGSTFIYAAFAENPFGGDGVSPATAR